MEQINIYPTQAQLNEAFTTFLLQLLEKKESVNICLSGGSTPKAVFDYWSENFRTKIPWHKIYFYWGDERCVLPTDEMSNYGMTKKHLFNQIGIPEENIFRIHGEADPEKEAIRYGTLLPLKFDLIVLGMGEDGHTASIFPENILLWERESNCVVSVHPESGMKRISITGKVINTGKNVAFLITGKSKSEKINHILRNRKDYIDWYPAARVHPEHGNLYWFLDDAAAGRI